MAEFAALPLFTDAYIADTDHLTDVEHGRYLRLLILMWRSPQCRIPNDNEWIARRFKRTVDEVEKDFRPIIAEFIQTDGNWLFQKRLQKEWEYCQRKRKAQSGNAKSRWGNKKQDAKPHAKVESLAMPPTLPTPTPTDKTRPKGRVSAARKPRATPSRIPENFDLDEDRMMFAVQRGFEPSRARILFEAFSNHHRAKGTTMLDWSAAWRTWVLNEIKFKGPPQHTTYGAPRVINGNTGPRGRKSLSDIKREGEERLRQMENRGGLFEHDHEIDL